MDEREQAIAAWEVGNYSEVIRALTNLLESDPNNVHHRCNRAVAYYKLELFRKCLQDCDAVLKLDPKNLRAYLKKGEALHSMGKKEEALKVFKEAASLDGDLEIVAAIHTYLKGGAPPSTTTNDSVSVPSTTKRSSESSTSSALPDEPPPLEKDDEPFPTSSSSSSSSSPHFKLTKRNSDSRHSSTIRNGPPADPIFEQPQYVSGIPNDVDDEEDGNKLKIQRNPPPKLPVGLEDKSIAASVAVAARGLVQHGVGDQQIDEKIALGYLQVNTGNYASGIKLFTELLKKNPRIVAAYLGRGTAYALSNQLDLAIEDFTRALEVDPNCVDALKRRGQTRAARGLDNEAIADLTQAAKLHHDHEVFHQRGLIYYKQKNYKRALEDFKEASKMDHSNKLTWNHMGLCYNAIGNCKEAIESHLKAISLDRNFKEAWANLAQAYKDWGNYEKAEQYFTKAIEIDPDYGHAYHLRALARFGVGEHYRALDDLNKAIRIDPTYLDSRQLRGVILHGLGRIRLALLEYEECLRRKPEHVAWYLKELALYWHHHLDTPLYSFNMDKDLMPHFKENWCKRTSPKTLPKSYIHQKPINPNIPDVEYNEKPWSEEAKIILDYSTWYGCLLHQDSPGYLPNKRQMRFAGLAALDVAQTLRAYFKEGKDEVDGAGSSFTEKSHKLGWRDIFDIIVRYRQFSEPNDPVWWVDQLTPEQFAEGFGSHTPIITGQCTVVRYGPMFVPSFPIMKRLIVEQCTISEQMRKAVEEAQTCKDLHDAMKRDFWVVTPCYSTATPGKIMEGTRLTLQATHPEGYEYSIRTPGTPPRWVDYDLELTHCFNLFLEEAKKPEIDLDKLSDAILTVVFYWYNFMPLSRGTAACGFVAIVGMFLSCGIQISKTIPKNVLVDWEGILRPTPREFIDTIKPWMYPARKRIDMDQFDKLPKVRDVIPDLRHLIMAFNVRFEHKKEP